MVGNRGARIILPKKFKKKIPAKKRMGPICDLRGVTSNSVALAEFWRGEIPSTYRAPYLARIFHESLAATTDMAVLPGVLGCRPLRRTVQVRLGTNTLWLPGGTPIFVVSRQQFMKYPG
jgi:hypothetical protein